LDLDESLRVKRVSVDELPASDALSDDGPPRKSKPTSKGKSNLRSGSRFSANADNLQFPIVLPPYNKESIYDPLNPKSGWGSCLLYMESLTVVVITPKASAAAVVNSDDQKNTYSYGPGTVNCLPTKPKNSGKMTEPQEFSFQIGVNLDRPLPVYRGRENKGVQFTVDGNIQLTLTFQLKPDYSWNLTRATANELTIQGGELLKKDVSLNDKDANRIDMSRIGGFADYSFACSSTPAIIWEVGKKEGKVGVGISFGNFQLQPFGVFIGEKKDRLGNIPVRFSPKVNDCVGMFSAGSLMGIVVAFVLLGVLAFGFLMLNSVQTMDRFDDPKQKQLIINAKD